MTRNHTLTLIAATILCAGLIGCGSVTRIKPLGNGYERVSYTQSSISEPEATQITLQYRKPDGRQIIIWPSAGGTIVRDDMAVFVGDKAWKQPPFGERWHMKPRLFVVRAPEPPLDLTDEIIGRWAQESRRDVAKALKTVWIIGMHEQDNKLNLEVEFASVENWPSAFIPLSWNQIQDVMREVKEKGVVHKDLRWGTSYIEKEFKPETTAK